MHSSSRGIADTLVAGGLSTVDPGRCSWLWRASSALYSLERCFASLESGSQLQKCWLKLKSLVPRKMLKQIGQVCLDSCSWEPLSVEGMQGLATALPSKYSQQAAWCIPNIRNVPGSCWNALDSESLCAISRHQNPPHLPYKFDPGHEDFTMSDMFAECSNIGCYVQRYSDLFPKWKKSTHLSKSSLWHVSQ